MVSWRDVFRLRAWRSVGLRATDRRVSVGAVRENDSRDGKAIGRVLGAAGLHRHTRVDVFLPPRELLPQLEELRPDVLHGYPGALARVADLRRERESTSLSPRFLMTGAEVLTPQLRRRIEEADGRAYITMYDPEKPRNGQMVMIFDINPMQLVEWILTDKSGLETHVFLDDLQTGVELRSRLFSIGWNINDFEDRHEND